MKKHFYIFLLTLLVPIIVFSLKFNNGYCASTALSTALFNSFSIASEYFLGKASRSISNSDSISSNISGVSGISDGYINPATNDALGSAFNLPSFNINNIIATAKTVDISSMTPSQVSQLAGYMANDPNLNSGSFVMKMATYGSVKLYYLVDKAGNWLGNSYNNILCKFSAPTAQDISNIQDSLALEYPQFNKVQYNTDFSYSFVDSGNVFNYRLKFNYPVYIFANTSTSANGLYRLYICYPESDDEGNVLTYSCHGSEVVNGSLYNINSWSALASSFFDVGTVRYRWGYLAINTNRYTGASVYSAKQFGDLNSCKALINYVNSNLGYIYQKSLIDSQGLPYTVPSLNGLASSISDLYPAISALRDSVLTIPTSDELAGLITDGLADSISDIIDGIKDLAITLPDVFIDETPVYDNTGISIPEDFPEPILDTLFDSVSTPFTFFSIFQPIFDIFGSTSGLFALWCFIPSVILIAFIIWALH